MSHRLAAAILAAACPVLGLAQAPGRPALANIRFEEDWSRFDEALRGEPFDALKNRDLGASWRLTAGGSVRLRFEADAGRTLAAGPLREDEALKGRAYAHLELRRRGFRWFAEMRTADTWMSDRPKPLLDHDDPDLQNFFFEWTRRFESSSSLVVRAGRQEMALGAERLVSPLDWSGTRRTFDGVSVIATKGGWRTQAFLTQPVDHEPHDTDSVIDDRYLHGVHLTGRLGEHDVVEPYLYWLRDGRGLAISETTGDPGDVERRTWGLRWKHDEAGWGSDLEASWQEGEAAGDDVSAWSLSWTGSRAWAKAPWSPKLGIGLDVATGDEDPGDGRVERFEQLYPLGHAYLGHVDLVARQNVRAVRVQADFAPRTDVTLVVALHRFLLDEERDALYNSGGAVVRRDPTGKAGRDVAMELDVMASWRMTKRQRLSAEICRWWSGDFVSGTGPGDDAWFFWTAWELRF